MLTKNFVLAGKAIFTVSNPKGERYTFRVNHKEANGNYPETWFVSLLTGPCNETSYSYLGKLIPNNCEVRLTNASKFNDDSVPVKVVRWVVKKIWNNEQLPEGYKLHHEGKCGRCGRLLTVPQSIESGFGPECVKLVA